MVKVIESAGERRALACTGEEPTTGAFIYINGLPALLGVELIVAGFDEFEMKMKEKNPRGSQHLLVRFPSLSDRDRFVDMADAARGGRPSGRRWATQNVGGVGTVRLPVADAEVIVDALLRRNDAVVQNACALRRNLWCNLSASMLRSWGGSPTPSELFRAPFRSAGDILERGSR